MARGRLGDRREKGRRQRQNRVSAPLCGSDSARNRSVQHLVDRTPVNPENPCRLPTAHPLSHNRVPYAPIQIHSLHPRSLPKDREANTGGVLRRPTARQSGRFNGGLLLRRSHQSTDSANKSAMQASSWSFSLSVMQNIAKWAQRVSITLNSLLGISFCSTSQSAGGKNMSRENGTT